MSTLEPTTFTINRTPRVVRVSVVPNRVVAMSSRSKKKPSQANKRVQDAARRQAKAAYLAEKRASSSGRYWHGGRTGLEVGTILIPRAEAERNGDDMTHYDLQRGYGMNVTDPERVYFSSNREFARGFAGRIQGGDSDTGIVYQHGALYEVEPLGEIEKDPGFEGGVSWCAPRARIIAVEESNVRLNPFEVSERLGPYTAWMDGSPVYTPGGRYIPSPEQIKFGGIEAVLAMVETISPWTPVEYINASIAGQPTGYRPSQENFPSVLMGGAEAIDVMYAHRRRATVLTKLGVTFMQDALSHLPEVNALLQNAGHTVLSPDDERGTVVAFDTDGGVIGALVLTGVDFDGKCVMLIDAISVAPEWQGRGIGTVMLLAAQQLLPAQVFFAAGHCDPTVAGFFAQAGYTVLRPGENLILPVGDDPGLIDVGSEHAWFYRQGPI